MLDTDSVSNTVTRLVLEVYVFDRNTHNKFYKNKKKTNIKHKISNMTPRTEPKNILEEGDRNNETWFALS